MKIRKNSKVALLNDYQPRWSQNAIPAGTELLVWKAKRDGTLYCSTRNHPCTVTVKVSQVRPVERTGTMPKVGDIYSASWGYEQTNIDFYQVVEVKAKSVVIREIAGRSRYTGPMCGETKPVRDNFTGDARTVKLRWNESDQPYFKVRDFGVWAYPTNPDSEHFFSEWH